MKKKILLISDNNSEVETITNTLEGMDLDYSLFNVSKGKEALNTLMGSSQGFISRRTEKVRPDIILLSSNLSDMTALVFLKIVRSYYSLKYIKVFVLIDSVANINFEAFEEFEISGYLQKPDDTHAAAFCGFDLLKAEFDSDKSYLALLPVGTNFFTGINRLKQKINALRLAHYTGVTTIGSVICVVIIIAAKPHKNNNKFEKGDPAIVATSLCEHEITSQFKIVDSKINLPVKEMVIILPEEKEPVCVSDSLGLPSGNEKMVITPDLKIRVVEEPDTIK